MTLLTYENARVGLLVKWYAIIENRWIIGVVTKLRNKEIRNRNDDIVWTAKGIELYMEGQTLVIDLDLDKDLYIMEEK